MFHELVTSFYFGFCLFLENNLPDINGEEIQDNKTEIDLTGEFFDEEQAENEISENKNDFSEIFSPKRFDLSLSISNMAKDITETTKNFIAQKIYSAHRKGCAEILF